MDLSCISTTNATISRADQSSIDNGSPVLSVQPDTLLQLGNGCRGAMVLPDEWLTILISTLPAKGEESLDLQSPLTASQLDNRICTPLPDQLVGSDDRHGYLTGRCGRYVAHRQRSHTLCLLMAHQHGAPTPCPFESGCLVLRQSRTHLFNKTHGLKHSPSNRELVC